MAASSIRQLLRINAERGNKISQEGKEVGADNSGSFKCVTEAFELRPAGSEKKKSLAVGPVVSQHSYFEKPSHHPSLGSTVTDFRDFTCVSFQS